MPNLEHILTVVNSAAQQLGAPGVCLAQANRLLLDFPSRVLLATILIILGITWGVGQYLQRLPESSINPGMVRSFNSRVRAWWLMYTVLGAAFLLGNHRLPAILLFFVISFWALREFITLTPTRAGDHRALFWVFFVFAPLQYVLVYLGDRVIPLAWGLALNSGRLTSTLIPVYAFLFIPARVALAGDHKRFLERTAKIQAGLLICVFCLSHAPALLDLQPANEQAKAGGNAGLLFFLILVVQMGDVFQYFWSLVLGKRPIAPTINASKTWEGAAGGLLSTVALGTCLYWVTPFSLLQAALMSAILFVMGFAGSMTMSAIKRDRGVKDYGTLVDGHVGVLDRFDSICFAAPIFYYLTRLFFA